MSTPSGASDDERAGSGTDAADVVPARLVSALRLRHPRLHLAVLAVLIVLAAVCVAGTITRMSTHPLWPLVPLAVAAYAEWRARAARGDRGLLGWAVVLALGIAVALWGLSVIAQTFGMPTE